MQKMLDEPKGRKEVVKKALFGEALNKQLRENYSKLTHTSDKQIFSKVVSGDLMQKYRQCIPKNCATIYRNMQIKSKPFLSLHMPVRRRIRLPKGCMQTVQKFFEDVSNSRIGAGKKKFITRKTIRKQKRHLLDTILNLYKKFLVSHFKISYQTFCRLRPFWVVKPSAQNRDTCLCVIHSNFDMKLHALHEGKIIPYNNYQNLLADLCCNRYNVDCLARSCLLCSTKVPKYKEFNDGKVIKFKMWVAERHEIQDLRTKRPRKVTKYLKKIFEVHPRQLIIQLHEDLEQLFAHERNIVHQYKAIKDLKQNLQEEDVLMHMDFSENYCTKYAEEIQTFHFGGSRGQLSLHTVIVYLKNSKHSYCTVSNNITHSPAAIWAHLKPIFNGLPPGIRRVHFLSDGPVTQYRNKTMFYIVASKLFEEVPDVEQFTWNYTESGHGKGAPDGVGVTCKRTADFVVNSGVHINDIEEFVQSVQKRCPGITCIAIDDQEIEAMTEIVEKDASKQKRFKGTLEVHQVTGSFSRTMLGIPSSCATTLTMRMLSCFCNSETCEHFKIGNITYDLKSKWSVEDTNGPQSVKNVVY
nr:unnamed protein product [Callosobruchus analis]